jgi:hypothetical protein
MVTPEGARLCSPSHNCRDLVARIYAAVKMVIANMLKRGRENAVGRTALCLKMLGGLFEQLL